MWEHCFWGPCTISFSKYVTCWVYFQIWPKLYLCICICVLYVRHLGTLFLRSSYHLPFKSISYHGSFQGFPAPELCDANKWDGWLDGTERAKLKEFTTFAVPRSVLPELQISFFPHWKMSGAIFWTFFGQDRTRVWHKNGRQTLSQRIESCVT